MSQLERNAMVDKFALLERDAMVDKFALQAMSILKPPKEYMGKQETRDSYKEFVERAYRIADAMMEERAKRRIK